MIETLCNIATSYTSQDFENWMVGLGTILIGGGTIGLAYAALKTIPDKLSQRHKDQELIRLYQKVVYRMYREAEASNEGIVFSLPKDIEELTKLLVKRNPQIGSKEDADRIMDDLMLDDYFKYVQGNATVLKTAKWNPKNRSEHVKHKIDDLPNEK